MPMPYVGEIRMFAGNFAPNGWELCQGQLLSIEENEVLFMLIGNMYGGDGQVNFALPDLRGRVPVHAGGAPGTNLTQRMLAESGGTETVTLTMQQMSAHTHGVAASTDAANATFDASTGVPAVLAGTSMYGPVGTAGPMKANLIDTEGGSQPHDNMGPYLCVNFIIALFGLFPSQN